MGAYAGSEIHPRRPSTTLHHEIHGETDIKDLLAVPVELLSQLQLMSGLILLWELIVSAFKHRVEMGL